MKKIRISARLFLILLLISTFIPCTALGAEVRYDRESYDVVIREDFYVGIYIDNGEGEDIEDFEVRLRYDENLLEYVQGGTSGGDGVVVINDDTAITDARNLLIFRSVAGGQTSVTVESAISSGESGNRIDTAVSVSQVPVNIEMEEEALIESLTVNGEPVEGFSPETSVYSLTVPYDVETLEVDAALSSDEASMEVSGTELAAGENTVYLTVNGGNGPNVYTLHVTRAAAPPAPATEKEKEAEPVGDYILLIALVTTAVVVTAVIMLMILTRKGRKITPPGNGGGRSGVREVGGQQAASYTDMDNARRMAGEKPVISVKNVSMYFQIATQNVSGIKEFAIQKIKGRMRYRELRALDHVSFDVYKGEVVGIIGTNGSGKSTLLKIVSGALKPTSGRVDVDRSKVQLLTLGTGFDMELTARENVYLNGAIIGYSKDFIDSRYDEIVEFAELDGFMDEKVKNFSSGMVSRLGFAIATIEDAPEILILDEVLSVGDEFFRKKSLARIKEMIHGGSTVLIVSHSMGTIKENCSKVVWIEKGRLRMTGTPDEVCRAYSHQNDESKVGG